MQNVPQIQVRCADNVRTIKIVSGQGLSLPVAVTPTPWAERINSIVRL